MRDISELFVNENTPIRDAMKVIDKGEVKTALVVDKNNRLCGVVVDGDIRRGILNGIDVGESISKIMNKSPIYAPLDAPKENILKIIKKQKIVGLPLVDKNNIVKDFILSSEGRELCCFTENSNLKKHLDKILVIGGAGYLGSVLARKLISKGYNVRVLDNLTYGDYGIKDLMANPKFEFVKGDIKDISNIVNAIKGVDAVIHLAAIVGDPACAVNPQDTIETNCLAMYNIIETCKLFMVNRVIFASTCSVYGSSSNPDEILREDSELRPVSLYAQSKIKCENKILEAMDENFYPTILRMATLYGYSPNMRFDLVVNLLVAKASFDKKITIFGGDQWRPFLHLEDAAEAYIKCLESPIEKVGGKIFNISSENHKINDIGNMIKSVFPEADLEISDKVSDKRNYRVSSDKIFQAIGFKMENKVMDGIIEIKKVIEDSVIKDYKDTRYRTSAPQM